MDARMNATESRERRHRRDQLATLEAEADPGVWQERRKAVRALLRLPLLTAADSEGRFFLVRKHRDWIRAWFAQHPDWQLVIDGEAARLVKRPARLDDSTRPCRDGKTGQPLRRRSYVALCLALAHLTRADRQETLGQLAEAVQGMVAAEPRFERAGLQIDLQHQDARRDFVQAIRLLLAWSVLERVQGEEDRFSQDAAADALYNVNRPVLARLLAAARPPSLVGSENFEDRLAALADVGFDGQDDDSRNKRLRVRLYRQLLDDPVLYYNELTEDERVYLDRQRGTILPTIEKATGLYREVRAEGIAMTDATGALTDYGLPEDGTEGHLTLLLASFLADRLRESPTAAVSMDALVARTAALIAEHSRRWRRNVREPGQDRVLSHLVTDRLCALGLARREGDLIRPLPAIGRYGLRDGAQDVHLEKEIQGSLFG